MKRTKAFFNTLDFIMSTIDKIFSLGCSEINDNYLHIPLFILGKLAKLFIGLPIGIFLGGLAVIAASIINLVKIKKENIEKIESDDNSFEEELVQEEQISAVEEINTSATKFKQTIFLNKKQELGQKINLAIQFLDQKISLLKPNYDSFKEIINLCSKLKSQLSYQSMRAEQANKFSHNKTESITKVSCPCGLATSNICNRCKMPIHRQEVKKLVPVYVSDKVERASAREKCILIQDELNCKTLDLKLYKDDYDKSQTLSSKKHLLLGITKNLDCAIAEEDLDFILAEYKKILAKLNEHFSTFIPSQFFPKCQYSQLFVASKIIRQHGNNNCFFQSLPDELTQKIIISTVPSDFAEKNETFISEYCSNNLR